MRNLIFFGLFGMLIFVLGVPAANAQIDANSSWKKILRSRWHQVDFPQIQFGQKHIEVYEVCVDGNVLKTKDYVYNCIRYHNDNERDGCKQWTEARLVTPRTYSIEVCLSEIDGDCRQWGLETRTYRLRYDIQVYRERGLGAVPIFMKNYNIEYCL